MASLVDRRNFLRTTGVLSAAVVGGTSVAVGVETIMPQLARKLPRWRGFNLLEKFYQARPFAESDFQWIAEWGFDFVRLPMDYRCWTDADNPYQLREKVLVEVDQAVEYGRKYGVHVNLSLHNAPGYSVAQVPQQYNLWTDEEAQRQFDFQWACFARRYRGIPSKQISFNLVNEPAGIASHAYAKVVQRAVAAIRREDFERLIIVDGLQWGQTPVFELTNMGIAQSTHCYEPLRLTHYKAPWVKGSDGWPKPSWPLKHNGTSLDRQWLCHQYIESWKSLGALGVGVHVGEWGAFNKTPHDVVLAWARVVLDLWKEAGWGWALWNFRGDEGILDSGRADVAYEDFHGHRLDRKMLTLLQQF